MHPKPGNSSLVARAGVIYQSPSAWAAMVARWKPTFGRGPPGTWVCRAPEDVYADEFARLFGMIAVETA
jgi:hypothetical protein